ncbi:MAG TPA: filamentous hemagglutinin N-terminal domain-containing protein, partial [Crinalium sp.]
MMVYALLMRQFHHCLWGITVGAIALLPAIAQAQVIPDNSLGAESSTVRPSAINGQSAELIEGGARRGVNLFHSFLDFDIPGGGQAYFANPNGIERILSRVTGDSRSDISGRLGVLGNADLFLLNPNGIVFGPNASLDIRGSFVMSTADSVLFDNGFVFSTSSPQAPPLLNINVPIGLQYGTNDAAIANSGRLAVGQDLTLAAGHLELQGQLDAGRDLTLQAQNTVNVRSGGNAPFLARAGGNLTIQGNQGIDIFAVNPLQPALQSGHNLTLNSNGQIALDAHVVSGGDFSIRTLSGETGNFISRIDPVITSGGDYSAGGYTGPSLQVTAGGNIDYGTVIIDGIDPSVHPNQPAFFLNAGGSITGTGAVFTTVPDAGLLVDFQSQGDISTQDITTHGGSITLTSSAGSITTNGRLLNTTNGINGGGAIALTAYRDIVLGDVYTARCGEIGFCSNPDTNAGEGGDIDLVATTGNITTGFLGTYSASSLSSNNGGAIRLFAPNGSVVTSFVNSGSFSPLGSGNAGDVIITANGDVITNDIFATSRSDADVSSAGHGGAIRITTNGNIITGNLDAAACANPTFCSRQDPLDAQGFSSAGNGGAIHLFTTNGDIALGNLDTWSSAHNSGNGGNVRLEAPNGGISLNQLLSYSSARNSTGNGGNVTIIADRDIVFNPPLPTTSIGNNLDTSTYASPAFAIPFSTAGDGGSVDLVSYRGNVVNVSVDTRSVARSRAGNGGRVQITAPNGNISGGGAITSSYATDAVAGNGGDVGFLGGGDINLLFVDSSTQSNSVAGNGGNINLTTRGNIAVLNLSSRTDSVDRPANAGAITLTTQNGNIEIDPTGYVTATSVSSASSAGNGGAISFIAPNGRIIASKLYSYSISNAVLPPNMPTNVVTTAQGGAIYLRSRDDLAVPSLNTTGRFGSGNITIISDGTVFAQTTDVTNIGTPFFVSSVVTSDTFGPGRGGDIQVTARNISVTNGSQFTASTHSSGQGGTITFNASDTVELANTLPPGELPSIVWGLSGVSRVPTGTYLGGYIVSGNPLIFDLAEGDVYPSGVFTQTTVGTTGSAGDIRINAGRLIIRDGAAIAATTFGQGNAGNISLNIRNDTQIANNGSILSGVAPGARGDSGAIAVETGALSIREGGFIQTQTLGRGNAGSISVRANGAIALSGLNSAISSQVLNGAIGNGGALNVRAGSLTLTDAAQISAATRGQGNAGRITAQIDQAVSLSNRAGIFSSVDRGAIGNGNTIDIQADTMTLNTGAQVVAATSGTGDTGSIVLQTRGAISLSGASTISGTVNAGAIGNGNQINLQASELLLSDRAQISASTAGQGDAGSISITANAVTATQGGQIRSATSSSGNAQSIALRVRDRTTLNGDNTGLFANTTPTSTGQGGNIAITTGQFNIWNRAQVAVNSAGTGQAGTVAVNANAVELNHQGRILAETVSSQNGNITLRIANRLRLSDRSQISASTVSGEGGRLTLNANQAPIPLIELDRSRMATQVTGAGGRAGDLVINAEQLTLLQHSEISASNLSSLTGGNIRLSALARLQVDNSTISASTQTGQAGNVIVSATNGVVQLQNRARLSVEATQGGTAGSLSLRAAQFRLETGSIASVSSPQGQAGTLTVNANTVRLDRSSLTAERGDAFSSNSVSDRRAGALIRLNDLDQLTLRHGSTLSAL